MTPEITKEEFVSRFIKEMVRLGGTQFNDGTSIEEYAAETAPLYWAEPDHREDGPEVCAESDIDCWEYSQ